MKAREGWCVWVTGLPGSGKSTVAEALEKILKGRSISAQLLSSDGLREVITPSPSYSEEERNIVYGALRYVAKLLTQNGVNVIIDATANRRKYREKAREAITKFIEVYLRCPLELCIEREERRLDTHGAPREIYRKGTTVPGLGAPYEETLKPELILDTDKLDPTTCANRIVKVIVSLERREQRAQPSPNQI